jgi:hypothetical protein
LHKHCGNNARAMGEPSSVRNGSMNKQCTCGWQKPLISTCLSDGRPCPGIMVAVRCPQCGDVYTPGELPLSDVERVARALVAAHVAVVAERADGKPYAPGGVDESKRGGVS